MPRAAIFGFVPGIPARDRFALSLLRRLADAPDSTDHMAISPRVWIHKRYRPRGPSPFVPPGWPEAGSELHDHERSSRLPRVRRMGRRQAGQLGLESQP